MDQQNTLAPIRVLLNSCVVFWLKQPRLVMILVLSCAFYCQSFAANQCKAADDVGTRFHASHNIRLSLPSGFVPWDLCWAPESGRVRRYLAREIARRKPQCCNCVIVDIAGVCPNLTEEVARLDKDFVDMFGRNISMDRVAARVGSCCYELEKSLVEIIQLANAEVPDLEIVFQRFEAYSESWLEAETSCLVGTVPYKLLAKSQGRIACRCSGSQLAQDGLLRDDPTQRPEILLECGNVFARMAEKRMQADMELDGGMSVDAPLEDRRTETPSPDTELATTSLGAESPNMIGNPGRSSGIPAGSGRQGGASGYDHEYIDNFFTGNVTLDSEDIDETADSAGSSTGDGEGSEPTPPGEAPVSSGSSPSDDDGGEPTYPISALIPGSGFSDDWGSGIDPIGSEGDTGYHCVPMAHWNCVPHLTVSTQVQHVGVVAFHINGIDRVEFSLDGGPSVAASEMSLNIQSGAWEYWAAITPESLLAADCPDGPREIRAIVYPRHAGQPRVLEPLAVNLNAHGSLEERVFWCSPSGSDDYGTGTRANPFRQPFRALKFAASLGGETGLADGTTVVLESGDYFWGSGSGARIPTQSRWASIVASDEAPSPPRFTERDDFGFQTSLLHVRGVKFEAVQLLSAGSGHGQSLWIDQCDLVGPGPHINRKPIATGCFLDGIYATDCWLSAYRDGFVDLSLVRGCRIEAIGCDAFSGSDLVVNCTASDVDAGDSGFHSDLYQLVGNASNKILYGVIAENCAAQGIFIADGDAVTDIAIVNVLFAKPWDSADPLCSQIASPVSHIVISGLSLPNSLLEFRGPCADVLIRGSHFSRIGVAPRPGFPPPNPSPAWFVECHSDFLPPDVVMSEEFSTGDPLMSNPEYGDFSLSPISPLRSRLSTLLAPVDVMNRPRGLPDAVGALSN